MRATINRRAFLRTAASVSAVAAGASAVIVAAAAEHPDAALLALGEQFDRLFAKWKALHARYEEAYAPIAAAFGPAPVGKLRYATWLADQRAECSRLGVDPLGDACDAAYDPVYDLAQTIIASPISTIQGLAIKARALKFDLGMEGNGGDPGEWDYDKAAAFNFFCEIERIALVGRA